MPSYKLTYFNVRGRAECVRLLFAAAGVKYEDVRFSGPDEWKTKKSEFKFGMLPEIEIDGKRFGQSRAIMYYLAREFGFYPSSHLEQLAVDEIIFLLEDLINAMIKVHYAKPEDKEALQKEFKEVKLVTFMGALEKVAKSNGDNGFMVGSKTTVADIATFDTVWGMTKRFEGVLDAYPGIKKVFDRVGAIEGIKKWVEERPKTEM